MHIMHSYAKRARVFMLREKGMSFRAIAKMTQIPTPTIHSWFRQERELHPRLSKKLNIRRSELL